MIVTFLITTHFLVAKNLLKTNMKLLTRLDKLLRLATDNNFTFDTHTLNICTMADKKSKT